MSTRNATPRRRREPGGRNSNIYRRYDDRFEVGYRDSTGRQRWSSGFETVSEARAYRDAILGAKGKGEHVQPNPRLRFGEAAERWLNEQVSGLRATTQQIYASHVRNHLAPRWAARRLDAITVNDAASLVCELRDEGLAERTIQGITQAASRVFTFASRRMNWHGENPIPRLEHGERPQASTTAKRRIYQGDELADTLAAAREPWRTLFATACVTGARKSELLGLEWQDLDLADLHRACVHIGWQVDRRGEVQELKTEHSLRSVELPASLARMLLEHKSRSPYCADTDFVFCTRGGRALSQRNVLRALRSTQARARTSDGRPTFAVLHGTAPVPSGAVPNFHAFRHTAASQAITAGDSAEEVAWMLGHKNSVVTRAVYTQEIKSAERRAKLRARMEERYGSLLERTSSAVASGDRADLPAARVLQFGGG